MKFAGVVLIREEPKPDVSALMQEEKEGATSLEESEKKEEESSESTAAEKEGVLIHVTCLFFCHPDASDFSSETQKSPKYSTETSLTL